MLAISRPQAVEVVLITEELAAQIAQTRLGPLDLVLQAAHRNPGGTLRSLELCGDIWLEVEVGQWLVKSAEGKIAAYTVQEFDRLYQLNL